jgi:UDP-N-acetylmuramoylalanine--D-glutamate ligase
VLLSGNATEQIAQAVRTVATEQTPTMLGPYTTLQDAVQAAREAASGDTTVILSPGCASFGMFRNEFHRGEEFRRIVMAL